MYVCICDVVFCIIDNGCNETTESTQYYSITFPPNETTVLVDVEIITCANLSIDGSSLIPEVTLGKHTFTRVIFDGKSCNS